MSLTLEPGAASDPRMVRYIHCPVHGQTVAVTVAGEVIGRCQGCSAEAAQALSILKKAK